MDDITDRLDMEEYVERHDDGSVTLHLDYPVQVKKGKEMEDVEHLTFRRSSGADWMAMDSVKGEMTKMAKLASELCGMPMYVMKKLDGDDFARMLQIVNNMGNHQKTGGTA